MERRKFLKNTLVGIGSVAFASELNAANKTNKKRRLVILHTNDFHSRIEPFEKNHPKFPNQGGIARIKSLVDEIREKEKNVLLLDCGDMFQGTPFFNKYGGSLEIDWMSKCNYHAGTLGNHDFDNGIDSLAKVLEHANFPIINCNYEVENTPLKTKVIPYKIFHFGKIKVGITACGIEPKNLIPEHLCTGIIYKNPIEEIQKNVDILKSKKCNLIVVLSHLGFEYKEDKIDDKKLAAATNNIDIILGGHTHTFLPKPITVKNKDNKDVIINQAHWAGLRLGKIEIEFT